MENLSQDELLEWQLALEAAEQATLETSPNEASVHDKVSKQQKHQLQPDKQKSVEKQIGAHPVDEIMSNEQIQSHDQDPWDQEEESKEDGWDEEQWPENNQNDYGWPSGVLIEEGAANMMQEVDNISKTFSYNKTQIKIYSLKQVLDE